MPQLKEGREIWLVNSFTDHPFSGNPAGVVPEAEGLTEAEMQSIAAELNKLSETAFILPPETEDADLRLRFFSSTTEVNLCGHATVAALFTLAWSARISGSVNSQKVRAETQVGILNLELEFSNGEPALAVMEQLVPEFALAPGATRAAEVLGLPQEQLATDLEIGCCSTGIWVCYVPLVGLDALAAVHIKPELIYSLWPENSHLAGVYAFAFRDDETTQGRFFSLPQYGIFEDPVTGTASGGLAAYLMERGRIDQGVELVAHQGIEMGRPGQVRVRRNENGRMAISGQAVPVYQGHLVIKH